MTEPSAWETRAIEWCNENPPPPGAPAGSRTPSTPEEHEQWVAWTIALHEAGLATAHWPVQWGGAGVDRGTFRSITRILRRAGMPLPLTDVAISLVAPAIMDFGTPAQKELHLEGIGSGRAIWTQLFSEPGSGSDLASLRVRATDNGDGFTISGQKVWNTNAHIASWGYLLARTGDQESRHRGLTMFAIPLDLPGITIRPIVEITGHADFNEVFFDDVRVPADAVIGEVGKGWAVSMGTLAEERRVVGNLTIGLQADAERIGSIIGALGQDASAEHRSRFAESWSEVGALITLTETGGFTESMDSAGKVLFSDINIALSQLGMDLSVAHPEVVPDGWARRWADNYVYSRAYTISGGASEILRNVLAQRGLGLPR